MALNFKIRLLLFLEKLSGKKPIHKMSPVQARLANVKGLKMLNKLIEYDPIEMDQLKNLTIHSSEADIPIRIYKPLPDDNLPILMHFHGGGYVIGNLETHDLICRRLAKMNNCIVIAVDYRLAPEHKYPAAPNDCYAATLWAYENAASFGGDPSRIAVIGDSAGGNLSTVVCMMCRDKGGPEIIYQVLVYPTTDATLSSESIDRNGKGYILTKDMMVWFLDHYIHEDTDKKEPYLSPLWSEHLQGLPPALVITAEFDPLIDEGVPVVYQEFKGMIHAFFQMPKFLKKSREALDLISIELQKAFKNSVKV